MWRTMTKVELVAQIKADLVARGVNLTGPCGAFAITRPLAWALRDEGYGLVHKEPGQNGCDANGDRFAIDALMLKDGQTFDVLVSAGGEEDHNKQPIPGTGNIPAWQKVKPQPPANWRAPFVDLLAPPDPPVIITDPDGTPDPPSTPPADVVAWAVTVLTRKLEQLETEIRLSLDVQKVNEETIMGALATLRSEVTDLRVQLSHGWGGAIGSGRFAVPITLNPIIPREP
jgi:hypothetical protein